MDKRRGITSSGPLPPDKTKTGNNAGDPQQTCHAEPVQWAIGRSATDDLIGQLRRQSGAGTVRVLPPGLSVTQEFRYGRLHVDLPLIPI